MIPLEADRRDDALEFLRRDPNQYVFLTWLIEQRATAAGETVQVYVSSDGSVSGVACFGRQVVLAADDPNAIEAFAEVAALHRFERMIVGPRTAIEQYWQRIRGHHAKPRLIRASQPVMVVDRSTLRGSHDGVRVRRARPDEWENVANHSAQMIQQELEYNPRLLAPNFDPAVRLSVQRGLWWVGEHENELCFFCNAGPHSRETLQLQGIWTPPQLRGRGLATAALFGICTELLNDFPTLSLYVNAFNKPAIALYERTGFRVAGEFMTLLF